MAAPGLDVDWEAIKAHALIHGVRQAARDYGIEEDTVKRRCSREGWLKTAGVAIIPQPLPKSMAPIFVPNVPKPSVAARNAMATLSDKSRLGVAIGVAKAAKHIKRLKPREAFEKIEKIEKTAKAGEAVFGWSDKGATPTLRLELIAGAVGQLGQDELPVIDVEAEVSQEGKG